MDYNALLEAWAPRLLEYAVSALGAIVLLAIAWFIAGWARRSTRRGLTKAGVDETLTKFFGNMARYIVLIAAVLTALSVFGIETTSFAAVLAAAGFAIGMALQGTLGNFAAGVLLLTFRPFKVGDVVNVSGVTGKVFEIELFTTSIDTPDNRRLIVPNGKIFNGTIENVTYHDVRRVDVGVGTAYEGEIAQARSVLERVAAEQNAIEDRTPQVLVLALGDSSINWEVRVWAKTEDYAKAKDALTHAVKDALDAAGISMPYPQRDVHIDGALQGS